MVVNITVIDFIRQPHRRYGAIASYQKSTASTDTCARGRGRGDVRGEYRGLARADGIDCASGAPLVRLWCASGALLLCRAAGGRTGSCAPPAACPPATRRPGVWEVGKVGAAARGRRGAAGGRRAWKKSSTKYMTRMGRETGTLKISKKVRRKATAKALVSLYQYLNSGIVRMKVPSLESGTAPSSPPSGANGSCVSGSTCAHTPGTPELRAHPESMHAALRGLAQASPRPPRPLPSGELLPGELRRPVAHEQRRSFT